jgi:2-deoxy-D-gluconate 3-dehydrogenase
MSNYLEIFSLEGQVSLVTGGGRGIGLGIAKALAGAGSDLMLVSRTKSQLEEAAQEISLATGRRVEIFAADVNEFDNLEQITDEAQKAYGTVDILVNNAGANIRKPFFEVTKDDFQELMDLHLRSAYFLTQQVAKQMVENGRGKIINLASLTSKIGIPAISIYGAAKGGVFALTKALAVELAPYNLNVNAVAPGYVRTAMTDPAFRDNERYEAMLARIPLKKFGKAEDIGNAALFLASRAADYITGEVIFIDGGWMAA